VTALEGHSSAQLDDRLAPEGSPSEPCSGAGTADIPLESDVFDLVGILSAVEETAYQWDLATDRIEWESNVVEVLNLARLSDVACGDDFMERVADEHKQRRQDAIARSAACDNRGIGARYDVQYRLLPRGPRSDHSLWLEETGHCRTGADGKPTGARGVIRVITDRRWEEQRLLHRCDHDELTGQLNRSRLTEALAAVINRVQRNDQSCAFLMAAVNDLGAISANFGFEAGDDVIAAVGRVIRSKLRGGDTIGRFSSNKFGIILSDCGPNAMRIAAERFARCVREAPVHTAAGQLSASVSIGGVLLPSQAASAQDALSHALQAVDTLKDKRHESFLAFEPHGAGLATRQRNSLVANDVLNALDSDRMLIALQPIVSARDRECAFYEALLRLRRPDGSLVAAIDFVPLAEQIGLARHIDRRTLELSADLLRRHSRLQLCVNVSGLTVGDPEWLMLLQKLTDGPDHLGRRLTVEITETAATHDLDATVAFVDNLKALGCRAAIDDFGAGYTSFRNLKVLDVDMVKIDGSFVVNLLDDPANNVFIRTLRDIADTFGMATVAEWVGDEATAAALARAGITYLQGYHFGRPAAASEIGQLVG
jgi:diguanylate cyclase (GGDEF)-like protein